MKKTCLLAVLALAAVLLIVPVGAKAEMYVEAYLGGGLSSDLGDSSFHQYYNSGIFAGTSNIGALPGHAQPYVLGGLKIGTWFVKEGFLGYNYPDWMKYLGFYLDFSYHRLDVKNESFGKNQLTAAGVPFAFGSAEFKSEGTVATLAFMFPVRYGFFPDSEVPFGRLQPYVAVGPAILFSTQNPTLNVMSTAAGAGGTVSTAQTYGSQSSTNIALAVDAGLRYMALKNVSIDASFKYRWANPSYSYSGSYANAIVNTGTTSFKYEPTLNLFSFQLGAAYHF
ncbi:MAG: outer membrane beta-barrel protein [Desulfobaccales bacterium]